MTRKTRLLILTISMLLGAGIAHAQEMPDLLGTWSYTASGLPDDPRCGEASLSGEMQVTRKIAARAYRGKIRTERSTAKCPGVLVEESALTVRIRDYKVSIDYDEEEWTKDILYLNGEALTGKGSDGVRIKWTRQAVANIPVEISAAAMSNLERMFGEIHPQLADQLRDVYSERLQKGLQRTGLNKDEVKQVTELTIQRMISCMFDEVRDNVRAQGATIEKHLERNRAALMLDPRAVDFKGMECVQDAALNAGVAIR